MHPLETFLKSLYNYLVGKEALDNNIIRKHTRKLETLGEISFPIDINSWHQLLENRDENHKTIFEHSTKLHGFSITEETLVTESQSWALPIDRYTIIKGSYHVFLKHKHVFEVLIQQVLKSSIKYGSFDFQNSYRIEADTSGDKAGMNLSELRLMLMKDVSENFLKFNRLESSENGSEVVLLTTKSSKSEEGGLVIVCGSVLNEKGSKDVTTVAEQFYRQRAVDMRMMAEHKYGLRITAKPGWEEFFVKLGNAAVTIDLLQNKPSSTITVNLNDHYIKNASFILYNCARLSALFKEFDKKVLASLYPALPPQDTIDFGLLNQHEEWELLFVYVLQFPQVVKSCIGDIAHSRINIHYLISMLSSMTSLFSIYYRRIRILTDPRPHLFPVLHARIYLLKAVEQVLHNSLRLLNIEPVKQM